MTHRIAPRPNTSARCVDLVDRPAGLLRRHVRRRAQHAAGLRVAASASRAGGSAVPRRSSAVRVGPGRSAAALARTLARPQSMTWTSPNAPTMTFAGFRSRWMTPWAWA